jgi:hypothetical protein
MVGSSPILATAVIANMIPVLVSSRKLDFRLGQIRLIAVYFTIMLE